MDGAKIQTAVESAAEAVLAGKVTPLIRSAPIPVLYVAIDGTGVPTVPRDTEGRPGKSPDGRAHTREVTLGCLFTQTNTDAQGRPMRDPDSSSYVATMRPVADFGSVLYAEAQRRGLAQAQQVAVLGDGAPWIWHLAQEQFPRAILITDLYHSVEHLSQLTQVAMPADDEAAHQWHADRLAELEEGDMGALLEAAQQLDAGAIQRREIDKSCNYFRVNQERMRYADYRRIGLFVGSGTVEAGCKTVVAQRLKQSGMCWRLRGATAIIALRCVDASTRWEEIW